MERSMSTYGQMTPVIVRRFENDVYELIDGFKRLRAAIKLNYRCLDAQTFVGAIRAAKAAMINLNIRSHTISELEKGLVIQSLHRQDRLTQVQIAALLNRHKSWVCRKLSLIERLNDEVKDHLKLGLINMTAGRELARLPRGNQPKALKTVIRYNFTSDETARLVRLLMKEPGWNHEKILQFPEAILEDRTAPRPPTSKRLTILQRIHKFEIWITTTRIEVFKELATPDKAGLESAIDRIEIVFSKMREAIKTQRG
jgi:ParB/RepB/Spo0J family partition protein